MEVRRTTASSATWKSARGENIGEKKSKAANAKKDLAIAKISQKLKSQEDRQPAYPAPWKKGLVKSIQNPALLAGERGEKKILEEKTEEMLYALDYYRMEGFDSTTLTLKHDNPKAVYEVIHTETPLLLTKPTALISESPFNREIVTFDPKSKEINELYKNFKQFSQKHCTGNNLQIFFHFLEKWMREEVFPARSGEKINQLLQQWKVENPNSLIRSTENGKKETALIPLDYFVKNQVGICRHYSLLGMYVLQRAIDEHLIAGKVYYLRANLSPIGGHSWLMFKEPAGKGKTWLVDLFTGLAGDLKNPEDYAEIFKYFRDQKVLSVVKKYY